MFTCTLVIVSDVDGYVMLNDVVALRRVAIDNVVSVIVNASDPTPNSSRTRSAFDPLLVMDGNENAKIILMYKNKTIARRELFFFNLIHCKKLQISLGILSLTCFKNVKK